MGRSRLSAGYAGPQTRSESHVLAFPDSVVHPVLGIFDGKVVDQKIAIAHPSQDAGI